MLTIPRPIALVGLPGAGKTTIGAMLAERLALPFRDSDAELERGTGDGISSIFATQGEARFRALERATIDRLLDATSFILATGGGAMTDSAARAMLLARATTIWLDVPPKVLAARLQDQPNRPLLAGPGLLAALTKLAASRRKHYRQATHHTAADAAPETVAARILAVLPPLTQAARNATCLIMEAKHGG